MPKFFQSEIAAYGGERNEFKNIKFKRNEFQSSAAAEAGTILESSRNTIFGLRRQSN